MSFTIKRSGYQILPITFDELDYIYKIERRAHPIPWERATMESLFAMQGYQIKLVVANRVIGFAFISTILDEAHLLNIAIDPKEQGKGYGGLLMRELLNFLESQGYFTLFLEVRQSNKIAHNLYTHLGFNQIGHRKNYYPTLNNCREDAIIMAYTFAENIFS